MNGKKDIALHIQSRCSELWSVDIHPGAKIGGGLMLDHVSEFVFQKNLTVEITHFIDFLINLILFKGNRYCYWRNSYSW